MLSHRRNPNPSSRTSQSRPVESSRGIVFRKRNEAVSLLASRQTRFNRSNFPRDTIIASQITKYVRHPSAQLSHGAQINTLSSNDTGGKSANMADAEMHREDEQVHNQDEAVNEEVRYPASKEQFASCNVLRPSS